MIVFFKRINYHLFVTTLSHTASVSSSGCRALACHLSISELAGVTDVKLPEMYKQLDIKICSIKWISVLFFKIYIHVHVFKMRTINFFEFGLFSERLLREKKPQNCKMMSKSLKKKKYKSLYEEVIGLLTLSITACLTHPLRPWSWGTPGVPPEAVVSGAGSSYWLTSGCLCCSNPKGTMIAKLFDFLLLVHNIVF